MNYVSTSRYRFLPIRAHSPISGKQASLSRYPKIEASTAMPGATAKVMERVVNREPTVSITSSIPSALGAVFRVARPGPE